MTDSSVHGSNTAHKSVERESLTQIEGIGKVKQQWLISMGIHTLAELAGAGAEDIETRLAAEGHTAHASEVERWIAQAQELVEESGGANGSEDADVAEEPAALLDGKALAKDVTDRAEQIAASVEVAESAAADMAGVPTGMADLSPQVEVDWQTFAAFTVEFQSQRQGEGDVRYRTLVRHLATDQEESWAGIEERHLQSWLRSQVAEAIPAAADANEPATADTNLQIIPVIEDLHILQPPSAARTISLYQPNMMFSSPIKGDYPFSLALQFRVQNPQALDQLEQSVSYQAECYVRSLKGNEASLLGKVPATELSLQRAPYIAYFPTTSLQEGIYRLQVFLSLEGTQTSPTFLEVPILQVI